MALLDDSAIVVYDPAILSHEAIVEHMDALGYSAKLVSCKPFSGSNTASPQIPEIVQAEEDLYRLNLSIGGMTCSSCTGAVTNLLKSMEGIRDFSVDLLGHSGYVLVADTSLGSSVESEIKDLGYDAKIVSVEVAKDVVLDGGKTRQQVQSPRTVYVKVDGFFCQHCPAKANKLLEDPSKCFAMNYTPLSLEQPTSKLTYIARPPDFTLRTIRTSVMEIGFTMHIKAPESSQDLARKTQDQERRRILVRLAICGIFCIPTFIIGVVLAEFLPIGSSVKTYWHTPIWGGTSRVTVALFVLATPIQFGIGQIFYHRAYKSL